MSAAEQLEDARVSKAGLLEHAQAEPSPIEAQLTSVLFDAFFLRKHGASLPRLGVGQTQDGL